MDAAKSTPLPTADDEKQQCENCRFWKPSQREQFFGKCYRYPPQLSDYMLRLYHEREDRTGEDITGRDADSVVLPIVRGVDVWFSPGTTADHWCGEWQPLPPTAARS